MEAIKGAGLITETPVIITNQDDFQADVEGNLPRNIKCGDILMIIHRTKKSRIRSETIVPTFDLKVRKRN